MIGSFEILFEDGPITFNPYIPYEEEEDYEE